MTAVQTFELVILLLGLVIPLELLARRLSLPPAAALIVGGMALALLPGREFELDPDLTLVLFLPPLLLSSAYFTVWREFRANLRIILQLAVGAVAFTTLVVGVAAHLALPSLPWAACFALGAIVSPPDAVAAKAVLQQVRLPGKMTVLLEGESLVNDASGLVLFRLAVAATLTGTFDAGGAVLSFGVLSLGGLAVGFVFGHGCAWMFKRVANATVTILGSLLAAWASYIIADWLGVSGVLSTVAAGLVLGQRQHEALSAAVRMQATAVWDVTVFVLESLVFVLIGLSLRGVLERLSFADALHVLPAMVAVVATVVVSRFLWIFSAAYLPSLFNKRMKLPFAVPLIMSWAGMRGVVSLAAALSLPAAMPGRDFILTTTFLVILVSVLVQGMTLGPLIRAMRLERFGLETAEAMPVNVARAAVAQVQLRAVETMAQGEDGTVRHPRLLDQYGFRARAAQRFSEAAEALGEARDQHFDVVLGAVAAGRREVLSLHRAGKITDAVLTTLERELDLEELTASRYREGR